MNIQSHEEKSRNNVYVTRYMYLTITHKRKIKIPVHFSKHI